MTFLDREVSQFDGRFCGLRGFGDWWKSATVWTLPWHEYVSLRRHVFLDCGRANWFSICASSSTAESDRAPVVSAHVEPLDAPTAGWQTRSPGAGTSARLMRSLDFAMWPKK